MKPDRRPRSRPRFVRRRDGDHPPEMKSRESLDVWLFKLCMWNQVKSTISHPTKGK